MRTANVGLQSGAAEKAGMERVVEGEDRRRTARLPACIDGHVLEEHPARVIDAGATKPDLAEVGVAGVVPERTARPAEPPATLLQISVHGDRNRSLSIRWLGREAGRSFELSRLTRRPAPA